MRDASDVVDELTDNGVKLNLGRSVHDPLDPVGRLQFNVLAMVGEFDSGLIRARTREGSSRKAKGRRGKPPKMALPQQRHLMELRPKTGGTQPLRSGQAGQRRRGDGLSHRPTARSLRGAKYGR